MPRRFLFTLPFAFAAAPLLAQPVPPGSDTPKAKVEEVLTSPARDANIIKPKIPPLLEQVMADPYSNQGTRRCRDIARQVAELDAVLGDDADVATDSNDPDTGIELAAAGARSALQSIIPGWGLVRIVTGADKEQRKATATVYAGAIRRSYLKGLGEAKRCAPPASPRDKSA